MFWRVHNKIHQTTGQSAYGLSFELQIPSRLKPHTSMTLEMINNSAQLLFLPVELCVCGETLPRLPPPANGWQAAPPVRVRPGLPSLQDGFSQAP